MYILSLQHKLQDIQCVAKDLELALAKREYESSNDHTSSSDHAPSSNEPLVDEDMATEPGEHERDLTSDKRIQFSPRSRYLRRTVGAGAPRARSETELHGSSASRHQLDEERLKWQMEMANLRRECSQVEIERDEFLRERSKLKEKAASFEQKYETLRREVEGKDAEQGRNLVEARDRYVWPVCLCSLREPHIHELFLLSPEICALVCVEIRLKLAHLAFRLPSCIIWVKRSTCVQAWTLSPRHLKQLYMPDIVQCTPYY